MNKNRISALWQRWHSARQNGLNRVRKCAKLTKPWLLPDEGHTDDEVLHEPFQADGALYVEEMSARLFNETFTPGQPWFILTIDPEILFDQTIDQMTLRALDAELARREQIIIASLESVKVRKNIHSRRVRTFYNAAYSLCEQLVYSGDTLVRIGDNADPVRNPVADNYRMQVHRRDQYVAQRDPSGDVTDLVIKERIDVRLLPPETLVKAGIRSDLAQDPNPDARQFDLYTHVCRQSDYSWTITQELNGEVVAESQEPVSPFLSAPWELPPASHYGRGPVEARLGAIGSNDAISQAILDFAAMRSDFKYYLDAQSQIRDTDLYKRPGSIVRKAKVQGGQLQDVACQSPAHAGDFSDVMVFHERLVARFQQTTQSHQGTQPRGERVTAQQSSLIASEVENARSGGMIPLEESIQQPLLQRVIYQLRRDLVLKPLRWPNGDEVRIEPSIITGMAQRRRAQKVGAIFEAAQVLATLGPEAQGIMDPAVAAREFLRWRAGITSPGLIKSPEKRAAEQQAQFQMGVAAEASKEAIAVAGDNARARTQLALTGAA